MYRILCDRMPARELGSGLTWFKKDGVVVEFAQIDRVLHRRRDAPSCLPTVGREQSIGEHFNARAIEALEHFGDDRCHRMQAKVRRDEPDAQSSVPGVNLLSIGGVTPARLVLPTVGALPRFS